MDSCNASPAPRQDDAWLAGIAKAYDGLSFPAAIRNTAGKLIFMNRVALGYFGEKTTLKDVPADGWDSRIEAIPDRRGYLRGRDTGRFYQLEISEIRDGGGQLHGMLESLHDVTELYESDDRVRVMIDAAPLCCNFWDSQFNNIDCNQEAAKLFDLPNKQAYLDHFPELSPELQPNGKKSADEALRHITKAFADGFERFEWMHQKLDGEKIPAEITLVRVKHRDENVVLGYTRDLRSSRELTKVDDLDWVLNVFRSLPFPTGVASASGKWIFLNKAALDFFGVGDTEELTNTASADWGGRLKPLSGSDLDDSGETYYYDEKNGSVYRRFSSTLNDSAGGIVGRIESIQDITTLYEADERVRAMVDAAPLCCNFWNKDFQNVDCNLEAAKLFDLPNKQAYLDRFSELSPEVQPNGNKSADEALRHITKAFKDGFERFEWMHQKVNGEQIPTEITLIRVKQRKGTVVLGYTRDLRKK